MPLSDFSFFCQIVMWYQPQNSSKCQALEDIPSKILCHCALMHLCMYTCLYQAICVHARLFCVNMCSGICTHMLETCRKSFESTKSALSPYCCHVYSIPVMISAGQVITWHVFCLSLMRSKAWKCRLGSSFTVLCWLWVKSRFDSWYTLICL